MMRSLFFAALLCLACTAPLRGEEPQKQQVAKRNYLTSLQSKHEGVRNSTIYRVLQYKAAYERDDCSAFLKRLQEMSLNDPSPKNRVYAFLACALLQDAKLRAAAKPPEWEEEKDAYFASLQELLQRQWAVANNN
ncbi:hypothetical protein HUU05_19075 [candidate division KSB1 bacterium]|nr:hypothetical protein [candidate division KSB1 bacterium]